MKLGLIYHQYVDSGGLEKYLIGLSRSLIERGHQLDVVTAKTDATTRGIPEVRFHMIRRPALSSMLRLWDFAWRSQGIRYDGKPLKSMVDLTIGFGRTFAHDLHRAGGGCHAVYSRLLPAAKRLGLKNRLELSLEWQLYTSGKTRHFVTNASKVCGELQATYKVDPALFSVIHTAVDTSNFTPCESESHRQQLRSSLGMPENKKVLLFVSSSHRRKGLGALIDALSSPGINGEIEVWIAGKELDARHRQRAQAIPGMLPRLRSLGDRSDLADLYRACDAFVHPTLYDACANTVLQAMASGAPSIVSAADGASEFIEHGANGYLLEKPEDSSELRHYLHEALSLDVEERNRMGEAARDRMLPLTWNAHVSKWEALFAQLKEESGTVSRVT